MPHCTKCGADVPATAQFCQVCGQPQAGAVPPSASPAQSYPAAGTGLSENAAACLSYVLGWVTGLIFYLIDHRPYVRFHAAQSLVTFGGLHLIRIVLGMIFGIGFFYGGHFAGFGLGWLLISLLGVVGFVLWIVCMIKAFQGERFMVPIAGDIAVNLANK